MSIRNRASRFLKFSGYSIGIGAIYVLYDLNANEWDIAHYGPIRVGRAGWAAAQVAFDYKLTFRRHRELSADSLEWLDVKSEVPRRAADRLLRMCCGNGGAYIKVGQHIGALDYLLPSEYVKTFKVLHSRAPQSAVSDLFQVVRKDLGRDPKKLFKRFDAEPLGTASLAQVHKAELFDGRTVAVKIQHPRVKERSATDIWTMGLLCRCVAYVFPEFEFLWLAEETKKNLPVELDFLHEGHNAEKLSNLLDLHFLKVPRIFWDLSTDRVLVMEYCEGGQVDDIAYMREHGISVNEVTRKLGDMYSEMIFTHGFVHCDPHPGNVLVTKDNGQVKIVLLDHGLYQRLTDEFRIDYAKLWLAMIGGDVEKIKIQSERLNVGDLYGLLACMVAGRSWDSIQAGIGETEKSQAEANEIADYAGKLLLNISKLLNRVPRQLLLIFKTNDLLRGLEWSLGAQPSSSAFINMSRVCLRAIEQEEKKLDCGTWHWLTTTVDTRWKLSKITAYEWLLWLSGR